ncbi:MAG: PBP1A family penicillin-binding protein [Candidatus Shapirobacteria bacterium]
MARLNWRRYWRRKRSNWRANPRLFLRLALTGFIGLVLAIVAVVVVFVVMAADLPKPDKIVRREGFATRIYDRKGELLYDVFANQRRTPVELKDVPQSLKNATIAIEDKNFYQHKGFDLTGIARAFYNIVVHHKLQGGSTLTQQLVKNVLLTSDRRLTRKIKEFILTIQIESRYSKDEILQMYLNEAPYGGTAWGVEAAAETYFGKKVSDLNLIESAVLAGLPQRPSSYSPFSDTPEAYLDRTKDVLRRLREDGYITTDKEKESLKELDRVEFNQGGSNFKAPHFVMYVKKQLEDRYGQNVVEQGGLRVYTTLDYSLQEKAQQIVAEEIKKVENVHITNGAAVVIDPNNGEILAMIGSKDYHASDYDGQVNVATRPRQPGSAIKPVTYVTAFKKGYTPATLLLDTQTVFPVVGQQDYQPVNYDGEFHGPIQLRQALGNSFNLPAVKMLARVGVKEMLTTAYELGLTTLEPTPDLLKRVGLSVTLGGGEVKLLDLTAAYSAFANSGLRYDLVSITKVTDKDGKILDERRVSEGKRVLTEEQAFLISHILSDNSARLLTFGEHSLLYFADRSVAVKTGTTNDRRDNWSVGWTPQIIVGVWVGNNDNSPMKQVASGISGASPIWRRIILEALKNQPNTAFKIPGDIVTAEVDNVSGYLAHDNFPSHLEYFIKGTQPTASDLVHFLAKLCRDQKKLATPAQIARGDYEEKEYFAFKEDDLVSQDGVNRWQTGINTWVSGQSDERYHPSAEYCGNQSELVVIIREPSDRQQLDNEEVKIKGEVISPEDLDKVEFLINDQLKDETKDYNFEKVFYLPQGLYTLKVRARSKDGSQSESEIKIGVKIPWDWQPSPTPVPSPTSTSTPTPLVNF